MKDKIERLIEREKAKKEDNLDLLKKNISNGNYYGSLGYLVACRSIEYAIFVLEELKEYIENETENY